MGGSTATDTQFYRAYKNVGGNDTWSSWLFTDKRWNVAQFHRFDGK